MSDNPMQAMMDGLSSQWQKERAETQMTLGRLIEALSKMPDVATVTNINNPHSYRGYYCDLAFELGEGTIPAKELLEMCKFSKGEVFEGYKGGQYVMGVVTPVWIAHYGCCGARLIGFDDDGNIKTKGEEE